MLFRFSKLRAIVNGNVIYELEKNKPVVIGITNQRATLVVTDGFHYTRTLEINQKGKRLNHLTVLCTVDDDRLLAGVIITFLLFLAGLTSGILFIRMLSFLPILYFLYCYYVKRNKFIKVIALV